MVIYGGIFNVDVKQQQIQALELKMASPGFWDSREQSQKVIGELNMLKNGITDLIVYQKCVEELELMQQLVAESTIDVSESFVELQQFAQKLYDQLDTLEIKSFLSGPHDACNAILTVHAGAGGTESCDWADMLFRLYVRWAERRGFKTEIEDLQAADGAGISKATIRIIGPNAYGYAKAERGVHRLVRISPFDSNKRRHTSFSSIDVIAEIEDDIDLDIKEEDLQIDTYRASGKGGQHVNKTDSAVRMTHLPSGLVVTCQNERSQLKNRMSALKMLKSRLFEKLQDEKRAEMERFYGDKGEIGWGNQIRSYVFQPYQLVKDLRTGYQNPNVQAVMDGDVDGFINAWLRAGCPKHRNRDVDIDV